MVVLESQRSMRENFGVAHLFLFVQPVGRVVTVHDTGAPFRTHPQRRLAFVALLNGWLDA